MTSAPPRPAAAPADPILLVEGLSVRFGGTVAVDRASLAVPAGGLTALLGPSGCGKTSLLRAIAGFVTPSEGRVAIGGRTVSGGRAWLPPEKRQVGMVFQEGALFPHLTVAGNVRYGVKRRPDAAERVSSCLRLVGMEGLAGRFPDELSGGQQQRVALARALAAEPRIVLLDEPFAALDATLRSRVREEVRQILLEAGATAILVTHDQEEALSIADRVAVMDAGRILQVGPPEEIYHRPATSQVARFVGEGQLLPCRVEDGAARTPLGTVPVSAPDGPSMLLVRPEDVELLPRNGTDGVIGRIVRRRFFGHDLLDEVEVGTEGGTETLRVRSLASASPPLGEQRRLRLRPKPYCCYPVPAPDEP